LAGWQVGRLAGIATPSFMSHRKICILVRADPSEVGRF
jgi:hypothetical protein